VSKSASHKAKGEYYVLNLKTLKAHPIYGLHFVPKIMISKNDKQFPFVPKMCFVPPSVFRVYEKFDYDRVAPNTIWDGILAP